MFGERDRLMGVSDNIMMGNMCPLGTGAFDLLLDETALESAFDVQVVNRRDAVEFSKKGRSGHSCESAAATRKISWNAMKSSFVDIPPLRMSRMAIDLVFYLAST